MPVMKKPKQRIMKKEKATYSINNPNPEWKGKGERWIEYALSKWRKGEQHDVAYIPHVPIEIEIDNKVYHRIPTKWDLKELPWAANFYMGGLNNKFRLNARYKDPKNLYIGSRRNVDLSPAEDEDMIMKLLKIAEKIYDPPEGQTGKKV